MSITILDVAREAGVSKSTVSLVLNNSPSIKQETQYKVRQAIQKLNYVPNYAARDLSSRRKHTLGIIFLTSNIEKRPYAFDAVPETLLYDISEGIRSGLKNSSYSLLTERYVVGGKSDLPELVLTERVNGIFLVGGLYDEAFIHRLQEKKIPIVLIGRQHKIIDSVLPDLEMSGYLAGREIFQKGHKNVLFVNGPERSPNSQIKESGFKRAYQEFGQGVKFQTIYSEYAGLDGYNVIRSYWDSNQRPDAVFAGSDGILGGILRFFYEENIKIPEDISVISYERSVISEYVGIPMTVIDIHKEQLGEEACLALLNRITKPRTKTVSLKISPRLIDNGSVVDKRNSF